MRYMSMSLLTDTGIPINLKSGGISLNGHMSSIRLLTEPDKSSAIFRIDSESLTITNLNILKHIKKIEFTLGIGGFEVEEKVTLGDTALECRESLSLHGVMYPAGLTQSFIKEIKRVLQSGEAADAKVEMTTYMKVKGSDEVEYETHARSSYSSELGSHSTILAKRVKGRGETVTVGDSYGTTVDYFNKGVSSAGITWKNPLDLFDSLINSLELEGGK